MNPLSPYATVSLVTPADVSGIDEVGLIDGPATLTLSQAATQLGMSRTHFYKLLDSGQVPFHRVGRDRRIEVADLVDFEAKRQRDKREVERLLSSQDATRSHALNELSDML